MADQTPIVVTQEDQAQPPSDNTIRLEDVFGHFPRVTSTPTWIPRRFKDEFAVDTTTGKIYYYDFTNNVWKSSSGNSYGGIVAASAASSTLPTGWSVAYNAGTNTFTVTHNLGTSAYTVVFNAVGITNPITQQYVFSANSFQVKFCSPAGAAGDTAWIFTLVLIS